jgi:tetratricopeptide (TPR) repeat protein
MPPEESPIEHPSLELLEYSALLPLYESAVEEDPEDLPALYWLGHAYTSLGRYEEGLEVDIRLTDLRPDDATARYNLGCSFALLGRAEEAFETLERAIDLGYREPDHMRGDPDLASIREDPRFVAMLERLEAD